ncbi:MAG: hypothetical protein COY38_03345 [Candidatus Aenigmarchaeota archaeon CG_4_10_14_0_8_um_filter_37_24]|nr:class I SAM-dependent methyltransferase [Candidatus Aenigmarchaeota archaeon]PIV69251.1 MAG: hypothetical protein COS07_01485 [Candidatus Aenigmarchaeota archaeon CG01_land_8_20_14_3_00_37_9]PIW41505.1 MAG: hypothetical protein COW21_01250 [Candidatus Aenigmarchaeota archaeon CG15_BIG_FIL_POST_REV_8_21_14_020_37_27]PIX51049.1 MAG: hypothetical protein COZ52_00590 [Candidatus Aenigmarchaeota archaeon CG_4_8_14_3_um_filter_37_24]PIY35858.1 MAG: hypothetical protein COZ04_02020 [Candidatus Aeni
MNIIRKKYDKNYFQNIFYKENPKSQRKRNQIKELLKYKNNGNLLEVGCGVGNFLKEAEKYFRITGVDISEYAVNEAKKSFRGKISVGNIEEINLESNHYDVIVVFDLLEHLKNPRNTIEKLYKSLKKEGILIGSVPNNFGFVGVLATLFFNAMDKTHRSTFSPHIWHEYFIDIGFENVLFFGEIQIINNHFYVKNKFWR